jgi:hypothetical protein
VQKLRKESGIHLNDDIVVFYALNENVPSPHVKAVCETMRDVIVKGIKVPFVSEPVNDENYPLHANKEFIIGGEKEKKVKVKAEEEPKKEEKKAEPKKEVQNIHKKVNLLVENKEGEQKKATQEVKVQPKKEKKVVEKKKEENKIVKDEKVDPPENIILTIYKRK